MKFTDLMFLSISIFYLSACTSSSEKGVNQAHTEDLKWGDYDIQIFNGDTIALLTKNAAVISEEGLVKNNKKQGFWAEYHDRTPLRIKTLTMYKDGIKNGPFYEFNVSNMPTKHFNYVNGTLNGDYFLYKNNEILEAAFMKDGKYHGIRKMYFPDHENRGKIQQLVTYKNGVQHGKLQWFDTEGNVLQEFTYKNGKKIN